MWKWFKKQEPTVKGMLILCVILVIGIIVRWDYVSKEIGEAFGGLFRRPQQQEQTVTPPTDTLKTVTDEDTDN